MLTVDEALALVDRGRVTEEEIRGVVLLLGE